ncbi:MAG: MBL fold metallo-hydrolase, partial [Clostridia bacterium]|nr:MBL fold metallo-hydrolase [Clostridia bacterium]
MRKLFLWLMILVMIPFACQVLGDEQAEKQNGSEASVIFINAGKADSTLLKIDGKFFLIDTGSPSSVPAILGVLSVMGADRISGLFLTHTDSDHIGGTEALCQAYPVDKLYSANISKRNKKDENRIERLARVLSLSHVKLDAGDHINIGGGMAFQVLAPLVYNEEDDNDNSLVLLIQIHGKRFLFTGDMMFAEEESLLAEGTELAAHVLKVGYHGNPDATSLPFAQAVSAEYAVISTDTAEAPQSANERVMDNLFPAQVLITERFSLGIRMDITVNGNLRITDLKPKPV